MIIYCRKDIAKKSYKEFIDRALLYSDVVSTMIPYPIDNEDFCKKKPKLKKRLTPYLERMEKWQNEMDGYLLYSRYSNHLPCVASELCFDTNVYKFCLLFYRIASGVNEVLYRPSSVFNWGSGDYPEDLSFFKDGYCWLSTSSSLNIMYIHDSNPEFIEWFKGLGIFCVEMPNNPDIENGFYEPYQLSGTGSK